MNLAYQPIQPANKRCGCYVKSEELLKLYPNQHILAPLIRSEYALQIANTIANVTLTQVYHNPTEKFLQLQYSFPINPNACVYRFVATFGNMRIEGIVKEKQEAKKEYQEAINKGKQAAYGEISAQSKDILNLRVGNISPKESVKIEIVYLQELSLSYNMFYQFHIMGTISPRYVNHIPKEDVIKAFRNEQAKVKGEFYWNFTISLRTTRKVTFFDSISHDIQLLSQNDTQTQSEFQMTKQCIPNKDFVFTYTTQEFELPSYVLGRTDISSTAVISFIPKFCTLNIDDAYKASVQGSAFETDIENAKGQYVFLLDRSGSMGGTRIEKAKEALILFIKSLPSDTYFNIISFGSGSSKLFPQSVKYNDKEVDRAVAQIRKMTADMGGTEIYNPLQQLLNGNLIAGYPKQIFLLTDGGVSNTEGVIKMVGINNKYSRVHTIGIGNGCSEQLILGCAKKGKGYHVFINDSQNPSQKIIQLLTDSLSPVISSVKLTYDKDVVQSIIPNPQSLPYILKGELVNFFITFKGQIDKSTKLTFAYQDSQNKLPYKSEIEIDPESPNYSFIDKMGQFKKIRLLEQSFANNTNVQDYMFYVKIKDKKGEIIQQSVKHQILSEFTAFICVQKQLVDGKYSEIKNSGQQKVVVSNPIPIYQDQQEQQYYQQMKCSKSSVRRQKAMPKKAAMPQMAMKSAMPMMKSSMPMQKSAEKQKSGGFFDSIVNFFGSSKPQPASYKQSMPMQSYSIPPPAPMCMPRSADFSMPPPSLNNMSDLSMPQPSSLSRNIIQQMPQEQQKKAKKKMQVKKQYQCQENQNQMDLMDLQLNNYQNECAHQFNFQSFEQKQQKKAIKKDISPIKKSKETITIDEIISLQTTQGSWKEPNLLSILFGQDLVAKVEKEQQQYFIMTYLIAKWIQKNHPSKQYSLVAKKGVNYAKKSKNYQKIVAEYEQYVK